MGYAGQWSGGARGRGACAGDGEAARERGGAAGTLHRNASLTSPRKALQAPMFRSVPAGLASGVEPGKAFTAASPALRPQVSPHSPAAAPVRSDAAATHATVSNPSPQHKPPDASPAAAPATNSAAAAAPPAGASAAAPSATIGDAHAAALRVRLSCSLHFSSAVSC